ncbi:MAG TPA: hypothetical protein VG387_08035 [Rhizomicrobium sp.]|jgi:hypothetical protein|nr:hypothetical protein [Rhizomicrobium sp.]
MNIKKSLILAGVSLVMAFGAIDAASASPWTNHHPRRVEVNHRLDRQDMRINREFRHGEIGFQRARMLHRDDHMIRHEERVEARFHHGHITRAEHRALNQQENGVSHRIGR